jgi:hypothetical protein
MEPTFEALSEKSLLRLATGAIANLSDPGAVPSLSVRRWEHASPPLTLPWILITVPDASSERMSWMAVGDANPKVSQLAQRIATIRPRRAMDMGFELWLCCNDNVRPPAVRQE